MNKLCKRCSIIKILSDFNKQEKSKDGLCSWCKHCMSEYRKNKNKNIIQSDIKIKICGKCYISKSIDNFNKGNTNEGYNRWCRSCSNDFSKDWYISNIETERSKKRKYMTDNKENIKKYNKERYNSVDKERKSECYYKNKEDIKRKRNEYRKTEEYKNWYSEYRKINSWKNRYRYVLKGVLKRLKIKKENNKTVDMLKYSDIDFKIHIENLFKNGMSWEFSNFQIDHIIPIVAFKKETPMYIVNSLENLRPISSDENIKKLASIDFNYIELYRKYLIYLNESYKSEIINYIE